jgi:flagellar hook-associated protein 2
MATLSSPGIGSGLDVTSIVTQLVAIERKPIEQLQAQATTIQTKLSAFGLLQSYATNVRDAAATLAKASFWTQTRATSSDPGSLAVSSTATAASGSYSVAVSQLAQSQGLSSGAYTDSATAVGSGTLRIELGTWNDELTSFLAEPAKTAIDIPISAAEGTLDGIKAKINAANAGVTASIVRDSSGARLVLRSTATGASSAVRISVVDDDGTANDAAGLSALAFDPPTAALQVPPVTGQMSQTQAATDAKATINGLAVTSSTNTLTDVIDGVTMTLGKVTTSPVQVNVALDTSTLSSAVSAFAKAYSDMNAYIASQTKYDSTTKVAATLQGDRSTLMLQSNLRSTFLSNSSASSAFTRLSDVGLEIQTDGSLKVNNTKLTAALANPAEVAKLFSSTASSVPAEQGFAVRVKAMADQLIASNGAITTHTQGLRDSITRNSTQQQMLEARVARTEARLTKQYSALDTTLAQISGVSSTLTQALAGLVTLNTAIAKN